MMIVEEEKLIKLPTVLTLVPVASSTWRKWSAEGKAPAKVKRGRCTFWRLSEVKAFTNGSWPSPSVNQGNPPTPASFPDAL